jgi:hypothetical protein
MAVKSIDLESLERSHLIEPNTKPVHSCVDHHIAWPIRRNLLPSGDLLEAIEAWPRVAAESSLDIVSPEPVKNDEIHVPGEMVEFCSLGPSRNEEIAAPCLHQELGRLDSSQSIGVRFHGSTSRDSGCFLKPSPVCLNCGTIDGQA